jgi:hypothetical protein
VSADGYAVAPIPPKEVLLDDYIKWHWEALLPTECDLPKWAPTRAVWLPIM